MMKRINSSFLLTTSLLVVLALAVPMTAGQGRQYDPATEATIEGTVETITTQTGRRGMHGVHVTLDTGAEKVTVHLGPASYIEKQKLEIAKGDRLVVTGSRIEQSGTTFVVARTVQKGDLIVTLRDERGIPRWSRGGPRR
jgi:hypothetical protein